MRKPLIAGNWKMNLTRESAVQLLKSLKSEAQGLHAIELAVFPPAIFLETAEKILTGTSIRWGAQNLGEKESGPYTGEISSQMLNDFGCRYVLIGHSERRHLFNETNAVVAEKFITAAQNGLYPIVCVGETLEERLSETTFQVIKEQIDAVLLPRLFLDRLLIAYEPVWAIGTGMAATAEQAQEVHQMIRDRVAEIDKEVALGLRILYGGSVVPDNAGTLSRMPDIDGALVGGASLDVQRFMSIAQQWKH